MSYSRYAPFPPYPRMFSPPPNFPYVSSSSPPPPLPPPNSPNVSFSSPPPPLPPPNSPNVSFSSPPPPPLPPPPPPPPPPSSSGGSPTVLIAVLVVLAVVVVGLAVGGYFFILRKKKNQLWSKNSGGGSDAESPKQLTHGQGAAKKNLSSQKLEQASLLSNFKSCMSPKNTTLSYEELLIATNGFSKDNLLGEGGFGPVFKGVINGRDVAVKKLKDGSHQGDREFQAEVETISRVHHKHLVSLVGYCITEDERLLAYEFVPNQTLHHHLSEGKGLPPLEWSKRLKIALGSAKGLAYLHEDCYPKTIHRDIKSENILLDFNFEPKVADFGLAKQTSENVTHVSTRIMGTVGYLAPEYVTSGKLTDKSDVFSFGVVLLELITGRRPSDKTLNYGLVQWARPLIEKCTQEDNYDEIVDQRLLPLGYNKDEMRRMVACADACVRQTATQRPPLCLIVKVLEGDVSVDELQDGIKLGPSRTNSPKESIKGKTQDNNEMGEHWKLALKSDVFSTTEHPSI